MNEINAIKKIENRMITRKIDEGNEPRYKTKEGKLLWIDTEHYDDYSQATGAKILIGADNQFWGHSDSDQIEELQ